MAQLAWKKNLTAIMDNPNFIELQIEAIETELKSNRPDTRYLRSKVRNIGEWLGEIDLAERRAIERKRMKKVM